MAVSYVLKFQAWNKALTSSRVCHIRERLETDSGESWHPTVIEFLGKKGLTL